MSPEGESHALGRIERDLLAQDPAFVARMRQETPDVRRPLTVPMLLAVLYIAVPITMLLLGWAGVLLTTALVLTVIAVVLVRRR